MANYRSLVFIEKSVKPLVNSVGFEGIQGSTYGRLLIAFSFFVTSFVAQPFARGQEQPTTAPKPAQSLPDSPRPDPDGVYRIGNGVSAPRPISMPDPEFSEKARKKKVSGACTVSLIVNVDGSVKDVKVTRSIAEGLPPKLRATGESMDQKAIEAVRQYRFEPGLREGKPVAVAMTVEVSFQVF